MCRLFYRLLDVYRTLGLRRTLWVTPSWLIRREFLVLVRDLRLPLPDLPACGPMRWAPLTEADIPQVCAINPAMTEAEIRRRWGEGQECLLCWVGDSLAHYRWESTRPAYLPYLGKIFQVLEGDILISEAFTHPAFRGRGINSLASILALHRARARGLRRSIALVAWWNTPAMRSSWQKAGRVIVGTTGYWNLGLCRHYFATGDVGLDEGGGVSIRLSERGTPFTTRCRDGV